jgi:hypothetical protein
MNSCPVAEKSRGAFVGIAAKLRELVYPFAQQKNRWSAQSSAPISGYSFCQPLT